MENPFKCWNQISACTIITSPQTLNTQEKKKIPQDVPTPIWYHACKLAFQKERKKRPTKFKTGHPHRILLPPATVSNVTLGANRCMLPPASHWFKFLHWDTSNACSLWQPSTMASTPTPVTRTQPRTDSSSSSSKWSPMLRREESLTALPQNDRLRRRRWGQPSARTSVAVSDNAQQKDYTA